MHHHTHVFTIFSKQVFRQSKPASTSPGGTGCPLSPEPQASIPSHWDSQECITTPCLTSTPWPEESMGPSWWHTRLRHKCPKVWCKPSSVKSTPQHQLSAAAVLSRTSARSRLGHVSVLGSCQDLTLNLVYSSCWEHRCTLSFTFPRLPLPQHAPAKGVLGHTLLFQS